MNCNSCTELLDQYLDGELADSAASEIRSHSESCRECNALLQKKAALRQALSAMPYVPPVEGFYDRALEHTVKTTQRNEMKFWSTAGLGVAAAASVIAWLVLVLPVDHRDDSDAAQLAGVTISLNVEKTVQVSFESVRDLQGATLTVQLPPGVEISGYGNRSEIAWSTDVTRGVNILSLPIVVRSGKGGTIVALIEHSGKSKTFRFDVSVS